MNCILPNFNTDFYKNKQCLSFKRYDKRELANRTLADANFTHLNEIIVNYVREFYPESGFAKLKNKPASDSVRTFFKQFLEIEESKKLTNDYSQTRQINADIEESLIMLSTKSSFNEVVNFLIKFLNCTEKLKIRLNKYKKKAEDLRLIPRIEYIDISRAGLLNELSINASKKAASRSVVRNKVLTDILEKNGIDPKKIPLNDAIEKPKTFENLVKNFTSALKNSPYYPHFCEIVKQIKQLDPPSKDQEWIEYAKKAAVIANNEIKKLKMS